MIEHKKSKDRLKRRMLEVTSSAPPKASPDNKLISEVHLEYRRDPKAPDVLTDSISMRFVNGNEGSKRKEHAKDKVPTTRAPSISKPGRQHRVDRIEELPPSRQSNQSGGELNREWEFRY